MERTKLFFFLYFFLLTTVSSAFANQSFTAILQTLTPGKNYIAAEIPRLHDLQKATTLHDAGAVVRQIEYAEIANQEKNILATTTFSAALNKRELTFVIVPGLLAEFIKTRAFEDLFSKDSAYSRQWKEIAGKSKLTDERMNLEKFAYEHRPMSEMIDATSIDDESGRPLIKLIILTSTIGSLESVGDNVKRAEMFNRRLEKYIQMTDDKNLVLLGYSRGTPLALEMLAQAEKQNLSYLPRVKALIAHAGVVMGSSLADLTADPTSESGKLFAGAKELSSDLEYSKNLLDQPLVHANNTAEIAKFAALIGLNADLDITASLSMVQNGDFQTSAFLILNLVRELGWMSITDFNGHVSRLKFFINEIIASVEQLRTDYLVRWWKTNTLPKHVYYLSVSAVMVDKDVAGVEKSVYGANEGYADTLDDSSLLANKRTYDQATGFRMNDSQVAIHQSQFLPGVIAGLNQNNADLKIKSLGILQSHHWGVSLQAVNKMRDGKINPFPRAKILEAFAIYINTNLE